MSSINLDVGPSPHLFVPLSSIEGLAIYDLLTQGCKLYYQRGKERIYNDPQVLPSHLIPPLCAPYPCDSIGVDAGSLPAGVGIIDLDNTSFAQSIKEGLAEETGISMEKTPSGGLHIWGRGIQEHTPKCGICVAGLRVEYFIRGRLTIIGFAGKEHNPMDPYNETGQHSSPAAARAGRPTSGDT